MWINEDEPDDLTPVGARVESDEKAAERVAGQDVWAGDACSAEQCVELGNDVRGGPRLGNGIAAAWPHAALEGSYGPGRS